MLNIGFFMGKMAIALAIVTAHKMALINKSTNDKCRRGCGDKGNLFALSVGM